MSKRQTQHDAIAALGREVARLSASVDKQTDVLDRQAMLIEQLSQHLPGPVKETDPAQPSSGQRDRVDITRAAEHLRVCPRTLRRALKAGAADLPGSPYDKTPGSKRRHWVFDLTEVDEWWLRWCDLHRPSKPRPRPIGILTRKKATRASSRTGGKSWAEIARKESARGKG